MLPTGHFAAGVLVAHATMLILKLNIEPSQVNILLFTGGFAAFLPDLDKFYEFYLNRSFSLYKPEHNHRDFFSHTPIFWLILSLPFFLLTPFYWGLVFVLGAWSHFVLDSLHHGIMWLWPWTRKRYALLDSEVVVPMKPDSFLKFWLSFLKFYVNKLFYTFILEIIILIIFFVVFWK